MAHAVMSTGRGHAETVDRAAPQIRRLGSRREVGTKDGWRAGHEFSRMAERLREKAGYIEDSDRAVGDLFNLDDD